MSKLMPSKRTLAHSQQNNIVLQNTNKQSMIAATPDLSQEYLRLPKSQS